MIRKTYFKTILVLFIVMSIFLSYSVVGLKKNYIFTNQSFDPLVYSPTPDWESDNPHYSTGCALTDINQDGWLDIVVADGNDILQI